MTNDERIGCATWIAAIILVLLVLLVSGCGDSPTEPDPEMSTDSTSIQKYCRKWGGGLICYIPPQKNCLIRVSDGTRFCFDPLPDSAQQG